MSASASLQPKPPSLSAVTVRAAAVAQRLPVLKRVVFIGCAVVTTVIATHFAQPDDRAAPADVTVLRAPPAHTAADDIPFFTQSWVTPIGHMQQAHGSSICTLPSGDILAIWYAGTREGSADVALFTSRLVDAGGNWTAPHLAMNREMAGDELDRVIKKIGNAVVFPDRSGNLWMVYVSVSVGGWSGSALNVKSSQDEGLTWSESHRLTINPFFNLGSLVRNKPIYADDGRIGLPVYHEMALKYPQTLWLTPGPGGTIADYRVRNHSSKAGLIQPALVPLKDDRMLMMLRDHGDERRLRTAYSDDNGWNWAPTAPSGLPNPDSAVDALRLRDGRIVLVYNDAEHGRENLRLAVSDNEGLTWRTGATLESTDAMEYSYPSLAEDGQGRIHLTYTWRRKRIRHVMFNTAWLDQGLARTTLAGP